MLTSMRTSQSYYSVSHIQMWIQRLQGTDRLPILPTPLTRAIAADRFAGGRGTALDTHTRVIANPRIVCRKSSQVFCRVAEANKPENPEAIKNMAMYRPATDIVEVAMMKPRMTTSHHVLMWKKRSPVRSRKSWVYSRRRCAIEFHLRARHWDSI